MKKNHLLETAKKNLILKNICLKKQKKLILKNIYQKKAKKFDIKKDFFQIKRIKKTHRI